MSNTLEVLGPIIHDRINSIRMTEAERHAAVDAMRTASLFVDGLEWVAHKIGQLGASLFLRPSVGH